MRRIEGLVNATSCCGVREIWGIGERKAEDIVYSVASYINTGRDRSLGAYYVFTDNSFGNSEIIEEELSDCHYGDVLKQFILDNKVGTVIETEPNHNPNSGNELKLYVWTLHKDALMEWFSKQVDDSKKTGDEILAKHGLKIGDFVQCIGNSANQFSGRAKIIGYDGRLFNVLRKDFMDVGNSQLWNIQDRDLSNLKKTRSFTIKEV